MPVVNFRIDQRTDRALAELTTDGSTISQASRRTLVDAVRLRRREKMRRESFDLVADPAELGEIRHVLIEFGELRAW